MMHTFVSGALRSDPSLSFHFAIVSSSAELHGKDEQRSFGVHEGFPADRMILPSTYYTEVVTPASSLFELSDGIAGLIDFYAESIRRARPDVVLINGTYYRPWALLQAARRTATPYVVFVHGSVVEEAKGSPEPLLKLVSAMERDFFDPSASYIFPSRVALERTSFGEQADQGRFHVISNALDETFFISGHSPVGDPIRVGFVLRWEEVKNTKFILDFIDHNERASHSYSVVVVSDIDASRADQYRRSHAFFAPPKTKEEMVRFYKEIDIIVNPSYFETFGYVPAEAVATGTPALVSLRQGISEVFLRSGLERLVVDLDEVAQVYEIIPRLARESVTPAEIDRLHAALDPLHISQAIIMVLKDACTECQA